LEIFKIPRWIETRRVAPGIRFLANLNIGLADSLWHQKIPCPVLFFFAVQPDP